MGARGHGRAASESVMITSVAITRAPPVLGGAAVVRIVRSGLPLPLSIPRPVRVAIVGPVSVALAVALAPPFVEICRAAWRVVCRRWGRRRGRR